jgi:hypothetical protein
MYIAVVILSLIPWSIVWLAWKGLAKIQTESARMLLRPIAVWSVIATVGIGAFGRGKGRLLVLGYINLLRFLHARRVGNGLSRVNSCLSANRTSCSSS